MTSNSARISAVNTDSFAPISDTTASRSPTSNPLVGGNCCVFMARRSAEGLSLYAIVCVTIETIAHRVNLPAAV